MSRAGIHQICLWILEGTVTRQDCPYIWRKKAPDKKPKRILCSRKIAGQSRENKGYCHILPDDREVILVNAQSPNLILSNLKFRGAVLDTGAQQSVPGKLRAKLMCSFTKSKFKLLPSDTT